MKSHYLQYDNNIAADLLHKDEETFTMWQSDTYYQTQAFVFTEPIGIISLEVENDCPGLEIEARWVKKVKAYPYKPSPSLREIPKGERSWASDCVSHEDVMEITTAGTQTVMMIIRTAPWIDEGVYSARLHLRREDGRIEQSVKLNIQVYPFQQPVSSDFTFEIWQNPFAVAEYYNLEPFSEEHIDSLMIHMKAYFDTGAHALTGTIVPEAWGGQTYSKKEIAFPSMVTWIKQPNGQFTYDFSNLETWASINKRISPINKIALYSIVPWGGTLYYIDQKTQEVKTTILKPENRNYEALIIPFLRALMDFIESKEWLDEVYLGIDEQGLHPKVFECIAKVTGFNGEHFKVSGAIDQLELLEKYHDNMDDLSIGMPVVRKYASKISDLVKLRQQKGKITTIYSCTGHQPGNFALSSYGENYWTLLFAKKMGMDGFLRWAFDSWGPQPLNDITHFLFESGDTFLVYPGEGSYEPQLSVRLCYMLNAIRIIHQLNYIEKVYPYLSSDIDVLFTLLSDEYELTEDGLYLSVNGKQQLAKELEAFDQKLTGIYDCIVRDLAMK